MTYDFAKEGETRLLHKLEDDDPDNIYHFLPMSGNRLILADMNELIIVELKSTKNTTLCRITNK